MHPQRLQIVRWIVLGLLLFTVVSLTMQFNLPQPTGPYAVGRTARTWVDTTRPEPLSAQPGDSRSVPAVIWYPAKSARGSEGGPPVQGPYFPNLEQLASALAASGEVNPIEVFGLRFIKASETVDPPMAAGPEPFPVIIFSPGNGTNVEFYAALAGELASYGYIVVGLNHPYDVAAVVLPGGSTALFVEAPFEFKAHTDWITERVAVRTADLLFVLRELESVNSGGDALLSGRLDLSRAAAAGHSLGGITAAEACRAAAQLRACLNLDGIQLGGPFSTLPDPLPPAQPFMMITKEAQQPPWTAALFDEIASGSYRVVVHGATHNSFTDGPLIHPHPLPLPNAADRHLALTRAYTLAFFNQVLKQQPNSLLGQPSAGPQVSVEVYPRQ